MDVDSATISRILNAAAEVMRQRGRAVGAYRDDSGRVCMIGAIRVACHGESGGCPDRFCPCIDVDCALEDYLWRVYDKTIIDYSDSNNLETCVATFEKAAKEIR